MKKHLSLIAAASIAILACCTSVMASENKAARRRKTADTDISVRPISNLPEDFIFGMDASSALAEENSKVRYYDQTGREQDLFRIFADAGLNYVRLRVWNDPYDADGNGYGGGNNDVPTAIALGRRATANGMRVCIDFHYSDFWADPKKQFAPKAWEGMNADEKADALYQFTADSLSEMLDSGVNVGMVQIGNEINNGMAGETDPEAVLSLLHAGSDAVRDTSAAYGKNIEIVVHYTDINNPDRIYELIRSLNESGLDYDTIGLSYYSYWHGPLSGLEHVVQKIRQDYGKSVIVAETAYPYTEKDGDGAANSVTSNDTVQGYPFSVHGQADMVHDICAAASWAGAEGVFYWEGAWIPVGPADADNSPIWEKYGSGWASSSAGSYDPEDAGQYYGGSSWDNQAFFDSNGKALPSLNVWKRMRG